MTVAAYGVLVPVVLMEYLLVVVDPLPHYGLINFRLNFGSKNSSKNCNRMSGNSVELWVEELEKDLYGDEEGKKWL